MAQCVRLLGMISGDKGRGRGGYFPPQLARFGHFEREGRAAWRDTVRLPVVTNSHLRWKRADEVSFLSPIRLSIIA